jgi:hypothetical protein
MANGWKITAIIFIILFIVETALAIWIYSAGVSINKNDNECMYNVCEGYESYYYNMQTNLCSCYIGDKVEHEEWIK